VRSHGTKVSPVLALLSERTTALSARRTQIPDGEDADLSAIAPSIFHNRKRTLRLFHPVRNTSVKLLAEIPLKSSLPQTPTLLQMNCHLFDDPSAGSRFPSQVSIGNPSRHSPWLHTGIIAEGNASTGIAAYFRKATANLTSQAMQSGHRLIAS